MGERQVLPVQMKTIFFISFVVNTWLLALLMGKALLTSPFLANTNVLALPFHSYLSLAAQGLSWGMWDLVP